MRAMRARLMMKVVTLGILVALGAAGARSCSSSSPSSPANPANVLSNGLSGVCAEQQADAAASGTGDGSAQTIQLPASAGSLGTLAGAAGISNGTYTCPTTTTVAGN